MPTELSDRGQDNWRALIAIADCIASDTGRSSRVAAVKVSGQNADDEKSAAIMLLTDGVQVFEDRGIDRLRSAELVSVLIEMEDRPWCEWRRGQPMTQNSMARLLKPFGIFLKNIRTHAGVVKGYELGCFQSAYERYANGQRIHTPANTPFQSATPLQLNEINGLGQNQSATNGGNVAVQNSLNSLKTNDCSGVADENPAIGPEGEF